LGINVKFKAVDFVNSLSRIARIRLSSYVMAMYSNCHIIPSNYKECSNSMRNNGNMAKMVMPAEIRATAIPRPISDLKNISIVASSFVLVICSDVIIAYKYFKKFTEYLYNF